MMNYEYSREKFNENPDSSFTIRSENDSYNRLIIQFVEDTRFLIYLSCNAILFS